MDPQKIIETEIVFFLVFGGIQLIAVVAIFWLIWRVVCAHEKIANAMFVIATHTGVQQPRSVTQEDSATRYGPKL